MAGTILVNTDTLLIAQGQLAALQNDLATLQGAVGSVWTNIDGAIQFNSAIS